MEPKKQVSPQKLFHILLAEDNEINASVLQARFTKSGEPHLMRIVNNGAALFDHLRNDKEFWPDVIILDIDMPQMTGIEALKKLKADSATKPIPVLMFTAMHDEENIAKSREAGAQGYVVKDISVVLDDIMNFAAVAKETPNMWVCLNAQD